MKNVIIGLIVIVAAGLGYYQFSYAPAQKAAAEAAMKIEAEKKAADEAAAAAKAAEEAAAATTTAATTAVTDAAAALDPAKFDAAKITAMIDASTTLDDATKTTLKAAVTAAAGNPALVQGAIDQVKKALGL
jgi:predicted negative regulator of RcsB-dependent stress response